MAARLILQVHMGYVTRLQGRIEQHGVTIVHHGIVLAVHQEHRRTVGRHMLLQRQAVAKPCVLHLALTQQRTPRTLVDTVLRHRHHRIDGHHKVRTLLRTEPLCCRHHQMTTSREAHSPYTMGIDTILLGMLAHIGQRLTEVVLRIRIAVASEEESEPRDEGRYVGRTITQHEGRDAVLLQPSRHHMTFCLHIVPEIAAPRAHHHGFVLRTWHEVGRHLHIHTHIHPFPDIHRLTGLSKGEKVKK